MLHNQTEKNKYFPQGIFGNGYLLKKTRVIKRIRSVHAVLDCIPILCERKKESRMVLGKSLHAKTKVVLAHDQFLLTKTNKFKWNVGKTAFVIDVQKVDWSQEGFLNTDVGRRMTVSIQWIPRIKSRSQTFEILNTCFPTYLYSIAFRSSLETVYFSSK